nr:hypothetical protein CFP56_66118 [Quercus suber]
MKHDLLEFQYVHFGDKTKPEHWFIDAETALNFYPDMDSENDELGYYDDGVRRTLTDDQIAMFRHSEVQELLRDCRLQREEQEYQMRIPALESQARDEKQPGSPVSHDSSLEDELVDASRMHSLRPPVSKRQLSPSSRSDTSRSTGASIKRQRKQEVPYEQRKKRNWEQYIQGEDERHGSITDDQIAMFRHSEVQELLRDCRLQREEQEYQMRIPALESQARDEKQPGSPVSHDSSLEDELVDASRMHSLRPPVSKRQLSPSSRSDTSRSTGASIKRQRKQEVPYEQRKKRNWEQYIQGEDERHGSITQRRLAREMDEQHTEDVMMDYGDDESVPSKSEQVSTTSTRRAPVSYEDL